MNVPDWYRAERISSRARLRSKKVWRIWTLRDWIWRKARNESMPANSISPSMPPKLASSTT